MVIMCNRGIILFAGLLLYAGLSFAQSPWGLNGVALEAGFQYGRVIPIHPQYPSVEQHAKTYELSVLWQTLGGKPWHQRLRYPFVGVIFNHSQLGNRLTLGNSNVLLAQIGWQRPGDGHRWVWNARLATGLAWLNRPFSRLNNPLNIAIGSRLNNATSASFGVGYRLTKSTMLLSLITLMHYSNGNASRPNLGINLPLAQLSVRYTPMRSSATRLPASSGQIRKPVRPFARFIFGINEKGVAGGPKFPVYGLSAGASRLITGAYRLSVAVDVYHEARVYDFIVLQQINEGKQRWTATRVALITGHELLIGHLSAVGQVGVFVHNSFLSQSLVSTRIGMQYYWHDPVIRSAKNLFCGIYVKSDRGEAVFLEFGLGYLF